MANETITLKRSSLAALLGLVFGPEPDPWINLFGNPLASVALNPQPLPPGPGDPLEQVALNPQPLPPRTAAFQGLATARLVANQALSIARLGDVMDGQTERAQEMAAQQIKEFVDDYCGTHPPRIPWPRPWPGPLFGEPDRSPLALLAAGIEFQQLAESMSEGPLAAVFADAAGQLMETAAQRLEKR